MNNELRVFFYKESGIKVLQRDEKKERVSNDVCDVFGNGNSGFLGRVAQHEHQ